MAHKIQKPNTSDITEVFKRLFKVNPEFILIAPARFYTDTNFIRNITLSTMSKETMLELDTRISTECPEICENKTFIKNLQKLKLFQLSKNSVVL